MLDGLGSVLQVGLTIVTLATLAGLGLMRGTVVNLRENLADARAEIADKDRRLTEAEAEIEKAKVRITSQANDLAALGRVVTGEAHWVALGQKLDEHHAEAEKHWTKVEAGIGEIRDRMGAGGPT